MKGIWDNFRIHMLDRPIRQDLFLDLHLMGKEELVGDVIISGSLGCLNYEIVKF